MTEQEREWFEKLHNQKETHKGTLLHPDYIGLWITIIDKYSDKAHFIYELIQNADDACATSIKFDLQKDGLWVLHNGKERFSVRDPDDDNNTKSGHINSITSIGKSTKIGEQKIGKFGVGFKAVFAYTETPEIYDNFNFKIENYIVPTEIKPADYERKTDETLFHFPFRKDRLQKAYDDILEKLRTLICPTLFLSNLEEVSWKTETENGRYLKKIKQTELEGNISYEKIELLQEIGLKATNEILWLFKRYIKEDKNHPYSIGFFLDEEGKLRKKQLYAFCFFPTKENTGLNFIVHAPFLLNDSREGIKDDNWNKELLHKLAELAADSLLVLKGLKLIDDNIINIIPYKQSMGLFSPFYEKIKQKFQTEYLLPTKDGTFARKENAYWAEYTNIPVLFSNKQLVELTKHSNAKWVFSSLGRNGLRANNDEKQKYIDDIVFGHLDVEKLLSYITPDFTQNQKFDWLHELYDFLGKGLKTYEKYVKNKAIFIDSEGQAISAFENEKLNLYFQAKSGYKTIHPALLENDNSKDFFIKFGIKKEPDLEGVVNKLLNDNNDINEHFSTILEYYKKCKECLQPDKINMLVKDLENKKIVVYKCKANDIYHLEKASEIYYPTENLLKYFETKPDTKFLDSEFYHNLIDEKEELLKEFLKKLGMNYCPKITKEELTKREIKVYKLDRYKNGTSNHHFYFRKIDNIDFFKNIDIAKSLLSWKILTSIIEFNHLEMFLHTYKYNGKEREEYLDLQLYSIQKWFLNKKNELVSAQELCIDDLSDDYDTTSECAQKLIKFLKINERYLDDDSAMKAGFKNAEEAKKAREIWNKYSTDRRIKKIIDEYSKARPKTFEPMVINVRTSSSKDSKSYLQEKNTNYDNQLICQICKREMPFKKSDGEYYFEIIEIFSKTNILTKEMEEPYLALCPVCAAKYRSGGFVDDNQKNEIKEKILNENIEANKDGNYEIPISLDYETTICFVAKHFKDLKAILELSSSPQITRNVEELEIKTHKNLKEDFKKSEAIDLINAKKSANLNSTEEVQEIEKVERRIGRWFTNKEQKNSRILYAFIKLFEKNNGIVTFKELKQETEMEDFEANFNQMKNFGPQNHGKIFKQEGEIIRFWEKIENIIWDHYKKI